MLDRGYLAEVGPRLREDDPNGVAPRMSGSVWNAWF